MFQWIPVLHFYKFCESVSPAIFLPTSLPRIRSRVGNFRQKKLFHGRRNRRNNWFVPAEFRLYRGTENSRNSVPYRLAEEKKARNKIESKLSGFRSKPFRGRETNSEFRSLEQKKKQTLGIPFRSMYRTKTRCQFCLLEQDFLANHFFFMSFRSVPSFGIDSSVNLGMPRNDHFLPQNNGNHSESIPRNFSERNSFTNPSRRWQNPSTAIMVQQWYKNYIGKWDHQAYTFTHYQAIMAKEKTKKQKNHPRVGVVKLRCKMGPICGGRGGGAGGSVKL